MKTRVWKYLLPLLFLVAGSMTLNAQTGDAQVPGDNFSLEGALELFKKSASPEEFEKMLNSADSKVNNLDLNGDGKTDYIRVIDRNEKNVHAFVMQAVISENENQDVAVIELEKKADGQAVLQIIGDADIYGTETIIEPTTEVKVNAGTSTTRNVDNVWAWPSVQYVYSPYYSAWTSPWAWGMYPVWWSAWSPVPYYVYNPWWTPYRSYYSFGFGYRIGYAQRLYHPYRHTSVIVYNRYHNQIIGYRSANPGYVTHHGYDRGRYNGNHYASSNGQSRSDRMRSNDHSNYNNGSNSRSGSNNSGRGSNDHLTWNNNTNRSDATRGHNLQSGFSRSTPNGNHSFAGAGQRQSTWNRSSMNSGSSGFQRTPHFNSGSNQRSFSQPGRVQQTGGGFHQPSGGGGHANGGGRGRH